MVKILTAMEARCIDEALKDSYDMLLDLEVDERDLESITEARKILKNLKEKTIEEVLGITE